MNRMKTLAAAAVLALGATSAFAQTGGDDPQHRDANSILGPGGLRAQAQREDRAARDDAYRHGENGRAEQRGGYGNRDDRSADRGGYAERDSHGYDYGRHWREGERLPPSYRSRSYVVDDWRGHHLRRPPAGYYWVQNGSDYLLVAIATGVIATIIASQ
jgi:Ni/Co efflux regulator RcnB